MPLRYELRDPVLWYVAEGDVDYAAGREVLRSGVEAAGAHAPARSWDVLFDIRESGERRSAEELRGIASFCAEQGPTLSRRCAVVAGDAFHFGLGRMFGAYAEPAGVEVRVFRDLAAAEQWLAEARDASA